MATYPEHEKLAQISDKSQAIGEFIDWLSEQRIHLAKWGVCVDEFCGEDAMFPIMIPVTDLLATHFGIDQNVLEDEKLAMLEAQRALNTRHD